LDIQETSDYFRINLLLRVDTPWNSIAW
jgi:hypothetical protein